MVHLQSIELRENAAIALLKLSALEKFEDPTKHNLFSRLTLRLVQDDNPTVRGYAEEIIARRWTSGKSLGERTGVEAVLRDVGASALHALEEEFSALLFSISRVISDHDRYAP